MKKVIITKIFIEVEDIIRLVSQYGEKFKNSKPLDNNKFIVRDFLFEDGDFVLVLQTEKQSHVFLIKDSDMEKFVKELDTSFVYDSYTKFGNTFNSIFFVSNESQKYSGDVDEW